MYYGRWGYLLSWALQRGVEVVLAVYFLIEFCVWKRTRSFVSQFNKNHIDLMATPSNFYYFGLALSLHFDVSVANINPLGCCRCYNFCTGIRSYVSRFTVFTSPSVRLGLCIRKQPFHIPLPTEWSKLGHLKKKFQCLLMLLLVLPQRLVSHLHQMW